jgi:hypothetical protein
LGVRNERPAVRKCAQRGRMGNGSKTRDGTRWKAGPDAVLPGDAAFATPKLYKTLEAEGCFYAIRLRANRVLQSRIAHYLSHPGP